MESCNAYIKFTHAFYSVGANNDALPESIRVEIKGTPPQKWREEVVLPAKELSAKSLKKKCPFLRFSASHTTVDNQLFQELQVGLQTGTVLRGYSLHESGAIFFPDGSLRFLRGGELIPERGVGSYVCAPEISEIELARRAEPGSVNALITCLFTLPPQALLTIAYAILTSVRSLVLDAGISLQAVLYIVGCQGMGKTTLATRIASLYRSISTGKPAAVIQAGSSISATEELLVRHRDQPVIVDDLCLSAGRETMRKRKELGAKLIRMGSGDTPIIKRKGHTVQTFSCKAGIILTAEFPLDNLSDLTRCIIVPVDEKLKLPELLTPELMGDVVRHYSQWIAFNSEAELARLRTLLGKPEEVEEEPRIRTNYSCLLWAFQSLIKSLDHYHPTEDIQERLAEQMDKAVRISLKKLHSLQRKLEEEVPVGNLAYCLYTGYQEKMFDLAKKADKLRTHEGVIWEGDLCLRSEALVRFIRLQPGFHNWTRNRITRELKDIGALVLQEEEASTVHLKHNLPRVYRLRLDVLKDSAQRY